MKDTDDGRKWFLEMQRASDGHYIQDGRLFDTRQDAMREFENYDSVEAFAKVNGWRQISLGHQGKSDEFPGYPDYEVLYERRD